MSNEFSRPVAYIKDLSKEDQLSIARYLISKIDGNEDLLQRLVADMMVNFDPKSKLPSSISVVNSKGLPLITAFDDEENFSKVVENIKSTHTVTEETVTNLEDDDDDDPAENWKKGL